MGSGVCNGHGDSFARILWGHFRALEFDTLNYSAWAVMSLGVRLRFVDFFDRSYGLMDFLWFLLIGLAAG
jgi:hypothetical protein